MEQCQLQELMNTNEHQTKLIKEKDEQEEEDTGDTEDAEDVEANSNVSFGDGVVLVIDDFFNLILIQT